MSVVNPLTSTRGRRKTLKRVTGIQEGTKGEKKKTTSHRRQTTETRLLGSPLWMYGNTQQQFAPGGSARTRH